MALDEYQTAAVVSSAQWIRVIAGAGSGKTRALVARIGWLVQRCGVPSSRILAITFSRKAAEEMAGRLKGSTIGATVKTIHALGLMVLRSERPRFKVAGVWEARKFLRQALRQTGDPCTLSEASSALRSYKRRDVVPSGLGPTLALYEEIKEAAERWDYDDLVVVTERRLQEDPTLRGFWSTAFDHILVDEAQDTDLIQWSLISSLVRKDTHVFVVGDISQCHPPGVRIRTSPRESSEKPIEELRSLDLVCGWNRSAQKLISGRRICVGTRLYEGPMLRLEVENSDRRVFVTPNHELLCRWNLEVAKRVCITYLMWRRGFGFRVGWCQLLLKQGNGFHLAQRARIEKADAAWILEIHESRAEASTKESIIATRFGLPTITFEPVDGAQYLTAWNIRKVFEALCDENFKRGMECLAVYGRLFEHPIYRRVEEWHRWTYFQIAAANIEVRLMKLPLADGCNKWATVTGFESVPYRGEVFSLAVEKDHFYSANGIVVHNSIYGWRGAVPMEMLHGIDERFGPFTTYQLPTNYRSLPDVVSLANRTVAGAEGALSLVAHRTGPAVIEYCQVGDDADYVVSYLMQRHEDGVEWRDMAVLYRINAQSEGFEYQLMQNRIPFVVLGTKSFYLHSEIQDVLAYLRLSLGWNIEAAGRVHNRPSRYLGEKFRTELAEQGGWNRVAKKGVSDLEFSQGYMLRRLGEFVGFVRLLQQLRAGGAKPERLVKTIYDNGYRDWLVGEEPDDADEMRGENLATFLSAARRYSQVEDLLGNAEACAAHDLGNKQSQRGNLVQLLTIHKAKGQEWPVVCLVGCNKGLLPHVNGDPEEERRLFYVAITRAMNELLITASGEPSQFINDYVVVEGDGDVGKGIAAGSEGGQGAELCGDSAADDSDHAAASSS